MTTSSSNECVFCAADKAHMVAQSLRFVARLDRYPLTIGHTLIVPRRHIVSLFDLDRDEFAEAYDLLTEARTVLDARYHPVGYNVGVNDGEAAGRTVDHLHIHLIPRYPKDAADPRGGIRNMLPGPSPDLWSREGLT